MKTTQIDELMHAVLDGEATEPQARELERVLAVDPAARARFEELKRLFSALEGVPEATPPADIIERILTRTSLPRPSRPDPDQLFTFSRVRDAFGQLLTGGIMSQPQNGNLRRRNIWIGVGLAAVGAVLFGHYVLEIPAAGDNLSGTVAPAQRYRSDSQVKPTDVRLGDQSISQLLQNEDVDRLIKDPGFQALAANQSAMQGFAANASAFAALASNPAAFQAIAANPSAFSAFAANPAAFAAAAANPAAAQASHPAAFAAMSANAAAFKALSANSAAMSALSANSQVFASMAAHAAAFQALSANSAAMSALSANSAAFSAMAANAAAFQALASNASALSALSSFAAKPNAMASMSAMQANAAAFSRAAQSMAASSAASAASASASSAASASAAAKK